MKKLHMVAFVLLVVGGINWLLVGLLDLDLVMKIFGTGTFSTLVYVLVGLSAIYEVATHKGNCKVCNPGSSVM